MANVNAHEAEAYARSLGRRLPTEAEWELAAASSAEAEGKVAAARAVGVRRLFPWGSRAFTAELGNLDAARNGTVDVRAFAAGDSAMGCRQMLGNVWEWTSSTFEPYPGFERDPYADYSQPWFHTHRVLRGGSFATRARLVRNSWRNFFTPDRRDVFAGLRTAADA